MKTYTFDNMEDFNHFMRTGETPEERQVREAHPHLMTLDELLDMVDGYFEGLNRHGSSGEINNPEDETESEDDLPSPEAEPYRKLFSFGVALEYLNMGSRVARAGWNGKNMFVFKVDGSEFTVNREPLLSILGEGTPVSYRPHLDMKMADGTIMVWTPAQADIFGDDWYVVD